MIFKAKPNCIPIAGRNLVIRRQFQCTYYITRLEIFWKEVCLILIVSITVVTMIHLLKCGWCLVTMNASSAHYIYTELWRYRQNLFRFRIFFSAQFWNYSCNRRHNATTYNLFRVTSMIFMIFKDKRPT